jgi:hypothetical protein
MPKKYSRSHERAEYAKISRGLWESAFGFLFSWLPGIGLILSMAGFCRQAVRLTEAYKVRRFFAMLFASVVLVAAIGALTGEVYLYSRNPDIASQTGLWVWQKVTGQQALPGTDMNESVPAADELNVPDEYNTGDIQMEEGDVPADGAQMEEGDVPVDGTQMEEGDVPVDGTQMEEGDVPVDNAQTGDMQPAEGDFQDNIDFSEDNTDEVPGDTAAGADATIPPLSDLLKSNGVTVG